MKRRTLRMMELGREGKVPPPFTRNSQPLPPPIDPDPDALVEKNETLRNDENNQRENFQVYETTENTKIRTEMDLNSEDKENKKICVSEINQSDFCETGPDTGMATDVRLEDYENQLGITDINQPNFGETALDTGMTTDTNPEDNENQLGITDINPPIFGETAPDTGKTTDTHPEDNENQLGITDINQPNFGEIAPDTGMTTDTNPEDNENQLGITDINQPIFGETAPDTGKTTDTHPEDNENQLGITDINQPNFGEIAPDTGMTTDPHPEDNENQLGITDINQPNFGEIAPDTGMTTDPHPEDNENQLGITDINQPNFGETAPDTGMTTDTHPEGFQNQQNVDSVTDNEDFSPDDSGDDYKPVKGTSNKRKYSSSSSSSSSNGSSSSSFSRSSSSNSSRTSFPSKSCTGLDCGPSTSAEYSNKNSADSPKKKGKKRARNPNLWKKNVAKVLKNSGKQYVSRTGKSVGDKQMKPTCTNKCRLACSTKFTNEKRLQIFKNYWDLASLQRQRDFLSSCVGRLNNAYRRLKMNATKDRKPNSTYSLINDGKPIRVCKTFLLNTLGIAERTLRTVIDAKMTDTGFIPTDKRGQHRQQPKVNSEVLESIRENINSIPRIESHYMRANTSREFIDGGLTIAEMHRHYVAQRESEKKEAATYDTYCRIFNTEFNISFFVPKKDQCDVCESYKNAIGEEHLKMEEAYKEHQKQKQLSRKEKSLDIQYCKESDSNTIVAIYDLQAVMPVPIGESSAFFYKSKLNCLNFTVSDIKNKATTCYFWHEGLGNRGSNEIGSCVFKYLQSVVDHHPNSDIILYSDNCGGQQKNRFILTMYHYAVTTLPIKSITHKFLIRGHTQNEGDTCHSIIEKSIKRAKKSGPIYVPDQYVQIIRNAKKTGNPFVVKEMHYDDFYDLKSLADDIGLNTGKNINGQEIKTSEIKIVKFTKDTTTYSYKTSYDEEFLEVNIKSKVGRSTNKRTNRDVILKPAYSSKICITGRKKTDLLQLIEKNIIPKYYESFYKSLF